jgi:predicted GIY-YIG superfamily endonuclease
MFYVVVNEELGRLKFGITSNGGRKRLSTHAKRGYSKIIRLITQMPNMAAVRMEESVKAALRLAREKPVHGTEYFDISVLALVLDIIDN